MSSSDAIPTPLEKLSKSSRESVSEVDNLSHLPCSPNLQDIDVTIPHLLTPVLTHNALPSNQEYELINEFRAHTEAALSKTRDEIFDVDRRIDSLLQQRREMELREKKSLKKLLVCTVASSPFRRIPRDVLQEISFSMLTSNEFGSNPCVTLSHVCSSWRSAVLGSPRLWTDLSICLRDEVHSKAHLLEYFGRAGILPLKLKLERARTLDWSQRICMDFLQWLLYAWPKIHQVIYLNITFPVAAWPNQTNKPVNFQSLHCLVFQNGLPESSPWEDHPNLVTQFPHFFNRAPLLVNLTVGHDLRCYPSPEFSFPWSRLTRLSLLEPIFPLTWVDILDECISLKFGSFSFYGPEDGVAIGTETVSRTQTSLQTLRLSFGRYDLDAFQLLRTQIFSNVKVLTIDSIDEQNLPVNGQYCLKSHVPSLKHLALTNYLFRSEQLLTILLDNRNLPQVSLEMDGPPRLQIPFFRSWSARITCDTMPYLSKLNIVSPNNNAININYVKAFSDMVKAWFASGESSRNSQTQDSYSVQLRILPTSARFVPNFYEELEDCTKQGLNLLVRADYIAGCDAVW